MIITERFRDMYCGVLPRTKMKNAKALGIDITVKGWWDRVVGLEVSDEVAQKLVDKEDDRRWSTKPRKTKSKKTKKQKKAEIPPKVVYVYIEKSKKVPSEETKEFISLYIENSEDFDKNHIGEHIYRMIHTKDLDWDYIQERLLRLEHKDFCKTNYWKYISAYTIIKNNSHCNRCPSETNLQTHHKTYEHKGRELFFMNQDLEVLCNHCHKQEHGI